MVEHMYWFDPDSQQTLLRNVNVPQCHCGKPCSLVACKYTGALFFVCSDRACIFILTHEEAPRIGALDVGQHVRFGESHLDRYTTLQYGMRWFGYTFSRPFWVLLSRQPKDADYLEGSFEISPGEEYTGFVSYRGGSGRLVLQTTLCGQFNTAATFYFFVVVCPILALCLSQIPDVCESSNASTWKWLVFADGCSQPNVDRSWFIFRAYMPAVFVFLILFWRPVFSFLYCGQKLFIDKLKNSCLASRGT